MNVNVEKPNQTTYTAKRLARVFCTYTNEVSSTTFYHSPSGGGSSVANV